MELHQQQQMDLFEQREKDMTNIRDTSAFSMDDDQKRAAILEYIKLRKTTTARKASQAVNLSPDTIYKYAERFGLADQVKLRKHEKLKRRAQPKLISVPVDEEHYQEQPMPQKQQVVVASAAATQKNVIVIMGDPESVKMALAAAFQMIAGK